MPFKSQSTSLISLSTSAIGCMRIEVGNFSSKFSITRFPTRNIAQILHAVDPIVATTIGGFLRYKSRPWFNSFLFTTQPDLIRLHSASRDHTQLDDLT